LGDLLEIAASRAGTRVAMTATRCRYPRRDRLAASIGGGRQRHHTSGENTMDEQTNKTMKVVWTVVDRGPGKSFWTRVGVGFVNRDGSLTLRLDAVPINGTLQVREWEAHDRRAEGADGPPRAKPKPQTTGDSLL
jgi:hypothetical protein